MEHLGRWIKFGLGFKFETRILLDPSRQINADKALEGFGTSGLDWRVKPRIVLAPEGVGLALQTAPYEMHEVPHPPGTPGICSFSE